MRFPEWSQLIVDHFDVVLMDLTLWRSDLYLVFALTFNNGDPSNQV